MKPGPKKGRFAKTDPHARAAAHWDPVPDWVLLLADAVAAHGNGHAAARIGYSPSVPSQVLGNKYTGGDLASVEQAVRGALGGETLACPVLGEVRADACLEHQKHSRAGNRGSELRVRLAAACPTCINAKGGADAL